MIEHRFERTVELPVSADAAHAWHARPGAFERLLPPWQNVQVRSQQGGVANGARVTLRVRRGPIAFTWQLEHYDCIAGRRFCDRQLAGPFRSWRHTHAFEPIAADRCMLRDAIEYALPGGRLGSALGSGVLKRDLDRLFRFRHRVTSKDLAMHATTTDAARQRIAITGSSGLIGSALAHLLTTGGHEVVRLVRRPPRADDEIQWQPTGGVPNVAALEGVDAVVHLAGENLADGRWTKKRKAAIRDSRVAGTQMLVESLAQMKQPPKTFVSASAVGIYGDTGDAEVDETHPAGSGFLAEVCQQWEAATAALASTGTRIVHARFGVVLWPSGGMLAKLLPIFKAGLAGRVGSGRQYMSWVTRDDAIGAIAHALLHSDVHGPLNVVAPNAVTNAEFTTTLGHVLGRPTALPVPRFALRLAYGEMADEAILVSCRAVPRVLAESAYAFRDPQLEPALRHMLGRSEDAA
jgi:uncharacterized protein (TIGR01777 family)